MGEYRELTHYIPFRKTDIVEMILADGRLKTYKQREDFKRLTEILASSLHFQFYRKLEALKENYYPMNPDVEKARKFSVEDVRQAGDRVISTLVEVLTDANYREIERTKIASSTPMDIHIPEHLFEQVRVFFRGCHREREIKTKLFGKKKQREYTVFDRVVLIVRFKPPGAVSAKEKHHISFEPGSTVIKLFKNVPEKHLKMLLPNCAPAMSMRDLLVLVVPAVVAGIPLLLTQVLPTLSVIVLVAGAYLGVMGTIEQNSLKQAVGALTIVPIVGGFCLQNYLRYQNKRFKFQKDLTEYLYFRNLVNSDGVFHSLVDSAEEEECKQVLLAYYFILTCGQPCDRESLDDAIVEWFESAHDYDLDFDVSSALAWLQELKLLHVDENGLLTVPPLDEALRQLDEIWDNIFPYDNLYRESIADQERHNGSRNGRHTGQSLRPRSKFFNALFS